MAAILAEFFKSFIKEQKTSESLIKETELKLHGV